MNSKKPIISVIVPAYNEEKLLSQCLDSLVNQDFIFPYEIILVNNNSTDNTVNIAKKYRITIVDELNKGVIFAKQRGLLSAKADIVAFLDADSLAPKNWLTIISQDLQNLNIIAVTGPYTVIDGPKFHQIYVKYMQFLVFFFFQHLRQNLYLSGGNFACRKKVLSLFGGFDVTKGVGEDEYGILIKLRKHGQVHYDSRIKTITSSRRASGGVLNFISQMVFRYGFNYFAIRLLGKTIFPPYNDFR